MIAENRPDVDRTSKRLSGSCPSSSSGCRIAFPYRAGELYEPAAVRPDGDPDKYKELIGLAVSGATRCRYCTYFHTEAARLFGASEDEITESAPIAKNTMGGSTHLSTLQFDYDRFVEEFDHIAAHAREQMAAGAPA